MLNVKKLLTKLLDIVPSWFLAPIDLESGVKIGDVYIRWGTNAQAVSSSNPVNWNTTFGVTFAYAPVVLAQVIDTQSPSVFSVAVNNITTTGCTFRRQSNNSTSYTCTIVWLAVGKVGGVIRLLLSKFATLFSREGVAVC